MKAIKFTLSGNAAFFKKPEFNSYYYFTYGQIHRVALLGIFGAMLGLGGYNQQKESKSEYPEFYSELNDIKVAIVPRSEKGYFAKKVQIFNNSTGFASFEAGGNLIVKEQWLEQPAWDIYVLLDGNEWSEKIVQALEKKESIYTLYLGKNDHLANISDVEKVNLSKPVEASIEVISLCYKKDVRMMKESSGPIIKTKSEIKTFWQYEEDLPKGLTLQTNHYELDRLLMTNAKVEIITNNESFWQLEGSTGAVIQFI